MRLGYWLLTFLASLILTLLIIASLGYVFLENQLPDVSQLKIVQLQVPLQVYTSDEKLIGEFGPVRRAPTTYAQIPPLFIKALLATEDQRFFQNSGIDIRGLIRASINLVLTGKKSEGASTITMQVARNFYLTRQKTFSRKFEEILLAMKINRELSKEKILELYLNKIYFGQQAYGIGAAAQVYYGKTLDQLTLPEMAMLAGLPQAPSAINPITNPSAAKIRRDHVLARMYAVGDITKTQYVAAIQVPIHASYHGRPVQVSAPYVGEWVRSMMAQSFGNQVFTRSYKVYTTINSQLQVAANQAVRQGLLAYDQRHGYRGPITYLKNVARTPQTVLLNYLKMIPNANGLQAAMVLSINNSNAAVLLANNAVIPLPQSAVQWTGKNIAQILRPGDVIWLNTVGTNDWQLAQIPAAQAALVALNSNNGAITALVGGFDFRLSNFNRVIQAERQPGSGFKPFIYAAAIDKGYTLASIFNDAPLVFNDPNKQNGEWRPQNAERDFSGPTRLRVALAQSLNLVSIRVLQAVGVDQAVNYITRFGFNPNQLPHNLTLALGTADVTPLQMANGYAVFANGGYRVNPFLIDTVIDTQGKTVFRYQIAPSVRVLSPETDFLMVSALKTVIDEGTGSQALSLGRTDLSGKTGSTTDYRDAWFNGFNGDIVCSVWLGFDQNKSTREYGATAALPIWIQFMAQALAGQPENSVSQPDDIAAVKIDPTTGLLARPGQANAIFEYFRNDNMPQQTAPSTNGPAGVDTSSESGKPIF